TRSPKQTAGDTGKPASAPKSVADDNASVSGDSQEISPTAKSPLSVVRRSPAQQRRSAKNGMASTSPGDQEDEPAAEESIPAGAVATGNPKRPSELTVKERDGLRLIGTIRVSPWKSRLVQDLILPTRPMTADEEETVEAVR